MASNSYHHPGIQPPTVETLRESADNLGLQLSDVQLAEYAGDTNKIWVSTSISEIDDY